MHLNIQALVLAAVAFEAAVAQPAHRHNAHKQFHARSVAEVLERRQDWNSASTYINPKTKQPYTPAQWQCIVAKNGDPSCDDVGVNGDGVQEKVASSPTGSSSGSAPPPASSSSAPAPSPSSSSGSGSPGSGSSGSQSDGGPGAHIWNKGGSTQTYVFYENDGNGAGQMTNPGQTVTIDAGSDKFISLPLSWKGHVQRAQSDMTKTSPATWAEFQVQAEDGSAWGDISLQKGCDGAVKIISGSDPSQAFGFTHDIISGAPSGAIVKTSDGQNALGFTTGGWMGSILVTPNQDAITWEQGQVGQEQVYILGGTGTQVAKASNNIMHVEFY